jgi:hypothetical protein
MIYRVPRNASAAVSPCSISISTARLVVISDIRLKQRDLVGGQAEQERESDPLKKRHSDAVPKVERLVMAVVNGGEEFVEIGDVLTEARAERDNMAAQL